MIDWLAAGVMGDKSLKMCRISTNLGFFVSRLFTDHYVREGQKQVGLDGEAKSRRM